MFQVTNFFGDVCFYEESTECLTREAVEDMNLTHNINIDPAAVVLTGIVMECGNKSERIFNMIRWIDSHSIGTEETEANLALSFMKSCRAGNNNSSLAALKLGLSANYMANNTIPLLTIAVMNRNMFCIKELLGRGANINAICLSKGFTALGYATLNYDLRIIIFLIGKGASQYAGETSAIDLARKRDYDKLVDIFAAHQ